MLKDQFYFSATSIGHIYLLRLLVNKYFLQFVRPYYCGVDTYTKII